MYRKHKHNSTPQGTTLHMRKRLPRVVYDNKTILNILYKQTCQTNHARHIFLRNEQDVVFLHLPAVI